MAYEEEWQSLARAGRLIWAAKVLAAQTGTGMAAVDYVETWFAKNCVPPVETAHRLCCLAIRRQIGQYATNQMSGVIFTRAERSEEAEKLDEKAGPDLSVWLNGETNHPPDLAVHIVYPTDGQSYVTGRVRRFFHAGARMVWLATPETRIVNVFRPNLHASILDETQVVSGEDVLPGFSCKVADLFG